MDIEERMTAIREEIRQTPYHKGTEHHIGRLKARLAQLMDERFRKQTRGGGGGGFAVRKSGDASVILVGPPSVGKSSLLNRLSEAKSKVGQYDFTTLGVVPGMMFYRGAKIQLFDVPGIVKGAAAGKGRGKEVLSVVRGCDLVIIVVDVGKADKIEEIKRELYEFGVRLDEELPKLVVKKDSRGGLKVSSSTPLSFVSAETVKQLATEFRIRNGEIILRENITMDRLIDGFMGNRIYLPHLAVVNKIDMGLGKFDGAVSVSAKTGEGLGELKAAIWDKLGLIRIYLKPRSAAVDNQPLIVKKGVSLKEISRRLNLEDNGPIKAKIFGPGAKYAGQEVSLSYQPLDGTITSFF